MMPRIHIAAFLLLAIAATVPAFSQSSPAIGSNGHIGLNLTGPSNLSISLYVSFVANVTNTIALRHYYPINLSQSQITAHATLHVTAEGVNSSQVSLYNPDFSSLSSRGINVIINPNNETTPFDANVSLVINPTTPSGLYNITVFAAGANNPSNHTVLHLKVSNPTNATFSESYTNTYKPELQNKSTAATGPSTTQPQQQSVAGSVYLYTSGIAIVIVIIAVVLLLRKRR